MKTTTTSPTNNDLWNPSAVLLQPQSILTSSTATSRTTSNDNNNGETADQDKKYEWISPEQEAARMKALKKLRHKLTTLCSKTTTKRPPVLVFERWLARYAVRRSTITTTRRDTKEHDCMIPDDGEMDWYFVKDLSRCMNRNDAQTVVETMTQAGQVAAQQVASITRNKKEEPPFHIKQSKKDMKQNVKAVKKAAKQVRHLLTLAEKDGMEEDDSSSSQDDDDNKKADHDNNNIALQESLTSLRTATTALEDCTKTIQRHVGKGSSSSSNNNNKNDNGTIDIRESRRSGLYNVAMIGPDGKTTLKPYLIISAQHLLKLLHLRALHRNEVRKIKRCGGDNGTISTEECRTLYDGKDDPMVIIQELEPSERILFLKLLYCCLARYDGLKGAGYQCAIPGMAFDAAIQVGLGITMECFASPFNCRYRHYCSAFPDVEHYFGSVGSFFDPTFCPRYGTYEANPPFVPELMSAMVTKLFALLHHPQAQELSFLVIVPAWGAGIPFVTKLETSQWARVATRIAAQDHSYYDGAQHTTCIPTTESNDGSGNNQNNNHNDHRLLLLRPSSWDTAIIVLQNELGTQKWPVTQERFESCFSKALKSSKTKESIPHWERRVRHKQQPPHDGGSQKKKRTKF